MMTPLKPLNPWECWECSDLWDYWIKIEDWNLPSPHCSTHCQQSWIFCWSCFSSSSYLASSQWPCSLELCSSAWQTTCRLDTDKGRPLLWPSKTAITTAGNGSTKTLTLTTLESQWSPWWVCSQPNVGWTSCGKWLTLWIPAFNP